MTDPQQPAVPPQPPTGQPAQPTQPAQPAQPYGQPGYPQPGYAQPGYPQPGYAPRPTNGLAIAALICGILVPVVGIILGHIAIGQINRTGEEGRGMAMAGLIVGYILTALYLLIIVFALVIPLLVFAPVLY